MFNNVTKVKAMTKNQLCCLNQFKGCSEFLGYIEDELRIDNWLIWDESLSARANYLDEGKKGTDEINIAYETLQRNASQNGISAEPGEIVSWLDTLRILFDAMLEIDLPEDISKELTIIQEYRVPFTTKRADYLLIYKNRILILEFSQDNSDSTKYSSKLQQVLGYKELLSVLCPENIEIGVYVYLIKTESIVPYNRFVHIDKHTLANYKNTCTLAQYIRIFFTKEMNDNAIRQLYFLDVDEKYSTKR